MAKLTISLMTVAVSAWLSGFSHCAYALKPANVTAEEMALIPAFCPHTMGFNYGDAYSNTSPMAAKWVAMMGGGFWHTHHYCWGRINYNRTIRVGFPREHKYATLKDARGDFYYVVNNTGPDFILLPEIFTWIGRISVTMREFNEAESAFDKAKSKKTDYWPPYFHHAELLISQGKRSQAMEVVKAGLQYSPNAKSLLVQYRDLGGKPEDIPPPILVKPPDAPPDEQVAERASGDTTQAQPSNETQNRQ